MTRIVSTDSRCKACWLQLCLKRLKLPGTTVQRLLDTLPREIAPVLMWVLKKPDPWTINIESGLQNKILRDYKLNKEIISALQGKKKLIYVVPILNNICLKMFLLDEDSDESNDELCSSENDVDDCSEKSDSDIEYNTKKGCSKKKPKLEEKLNDDKVKKKKIKKVDVFRDVQQNYNKRIPSVRSLNAATSNLLASKGMLKIIS